MSSDTPLGKMNDGLAAAAAAAASSLHKGDDDTFHKDDDSKVEVSSVESSISTVSDSLSLAQQQQQQRLQQQQQQQKQQQVNGKGVDGTDFLKHLREAGAFEPAIRNQDTFGSSNKRNERQNLSTLSKLFETSSTGLDRSSLLNKIERMSNEDTIGRSNTTAAASQNNKNSQPRFSSLADLFEGPTSKYAPIPPLVSAPSPPPPSSVEPQQPQPPPPPPSVDPAAPGVQSAFNNDVTSPMPPKYTSSISTPQTVSPKPALKHPSSYGSRSSGGNNDMLFGRETSTAGGLQPVKSHNRSVSWGNNVIQGNESSLGSRGGDGGSGGGGGAGDPSHRQGKVHRREHSFESVSSLGGEGGGNGSGNARTGHKRENTRTLLTLEDLLGDGPYEAEAESNIIVALEAQQAIRGNKLRARSNTDTSSSLLGQVPESTCHDFTIDEAELHSQDTLASSQSMRNLGPSASSSKRHLMTSPERNSNSKDHNDKDSERQKLLAPKRKRQAQHNRQQSVEMTLVGLTEAMSELHGTTGSAKTRAPDERFSSADRFAENATRLAENQPHDTGGGASAHARNHRFWRIENLPIVDENLDQEGNVSHATTDDNNADVGSSERMKNVDSDVEQGNSVPLENVKEESHDDGTDDGVGGSHNATQSTRKNSRKHTLFGDATDKLKSEWEAFGQFFRPRRDRMKTYVKTILLYIVVPLTGSAAILFYFAGNPGPAGKPSSSWWLLYAVRQVTTFSMALALQGVFVDFLALRTKTMLRLVGPIVTLLIVQAKGWPFIIFWWSLLNFGFLANASRFASHWLYFQNLIGLFNEENPNGNFASGELHTTVMIIGVTVSALVAVKRFVIGLYLGRQTFTRYGENLANVMNDMLLVSQVAELARDIERSRSNDDKIIRLTSEAFGWNGELRSMVFADDGTITTPANSVDESRSKIIESSSRDQVTGSLPLHEKAKVMQLLGQWEEPKRASDPRQIEIASISAVLRFRKALTFIHRKYPFGFAFGQANTRESCIESAQQVYEKLLLRDDSDEPILQFETLALLALTDDDESLDQDIAKALIRLFRPDREGNLTLLDFVKSVDGVYKEFRMLSASIANSSQIDKAFENMFNFVFYAAVITIVLSILGFSPLALFLSLSSILLGFAFMVGSASSKYFEGVLFILVRRPYGIGDRIHISDVEKDTSIEGSAGWVVENVTLFETIATWTPTRERCSLSNGSLANSRIINAARSPQAQFHLFLKFPIDAPYDKVLVFKAAVEEYMRARPREWLALNGFRAFRVVADQGYVEYAIVIQHRESWQNIGQILDSKANLSSYCNEVAKQLNMHYRAPPLPVDLRFLNNSSAMASVMGATGENMVVGGGFVRDPAPATASELYRNQEIPRHQPTASALSGDSSINREAQMKRFRQIALENHQIKFS